VTIFPPRSIPLSLFAIPLGLAGLGAVWSQASTLLSAAAWPSEMLYSMSAILWLAFTASYALHSARHTGSLRRDLRHPQTSHLSAYVPVVGLLLVAHYGARVPAEVALSACLVLVVAVAVLAAHTLSYWFTSTVSVEAIHPGFLLPVVASAFIASIAFTSVGAAGASVAAIGVGLFFWLVVGTLVISRLIVGTALPAALVPSMAVLATPPATGGTAWLLAHPGVSESFPDAFAGILMMMILVQFMLFPLYLRLRFSLAFWTFSFPIAASTNFLLRWMPGRIAPEWYPVGWVVIAIATLAIGVIAIRTVILLVATSTLVRLRA
jgi:tellurite resistance protein